MTDSTHPNLLDDADAPESAEESGCGGQCSCGETDEASPELDVRQIPHEIRQASVFGAIAAIRPGDSIVLIAPHVPVPLLEQIDAAQPGEWTSSISQSGPEEWRARLTRAL